MSRRWALAVLAVALVLSLVGGCAGRKTESPGATGAGEYGGTLVIAINTDPGTLNPLTESSDVPQAICNNIFNKLVEFDKDFNIKPDLAKSWEIQDEGRTYVFHLAEGVKWHDGKPLTSADVKFSLETAKEVGATKSRLQDIEAIETPDDKTVVLRLKKPSGTLLPILAWGCTQIIPKHLYEGTNISENQYNLKPVGTGPFRFEDWKRGEYVSVVANTDYFKGRPYLDKIVFKIIPDTQSALAALEAGEIQALSMYSSPPFRDLPRLQQDPRFRVITWNHYTYWRLLFNLKERPFDDVRVRRAIAHAIDKAKIVAACYAGVPQPAPNAGPLSPAVAWAFNKNAPDYPYDPAKAEALLEEAGLKKDASGIRLRCTLDFVDYIPGDKDMWLMVRDMLRQVGIEVELKQYDPAAWNEKVYKQKQFQLAFAGGGTGPDPDNLRYMYHSTGSGNAGGYANAEVDRLLEEAAQLMKPEERVPLYYKVQELIAADLPSIPIWNIVLSEVWSKQFEGREGYSLFFADLANIKYVPGK